MKNPVIRFLLPLTLVLLLASCASNQSDGPFTESHTGAENSEEFIQDVEIETTARAAVQFAILALHEGNTEAATALKDYLDSLLPTLPAGPEVQPEALMAQVKSELTAAQQARLADELAAADRHLSGKLANGSIVDSLQFFTGAAFVSWMREAAEWSANGYNYDIVCSHGIALDDHRHNAGTGIRIDLDFNKVERKRLEVER
jgi:hypothetical protein